MDQAEQPDAVSVSNSPAQKKPHKVTERTVLRVRSLTLSLALGIALTEIHVSQARISGTMHTSILSVLVFFLLSILVRHQVEAQSQGNVNATLTFTSSTSLFYYTFPTVVTTTIPKCAVCLRNAGKNSFTDEFY
jgi:hypothetical protein